MSGVELKPISGSGRTNILLPLGKTNIGRGSFFGIADKRVSRNHAILEVEDGKVKVMPIHTNPTFFRGEGGSNLAPLTKDAWWQLKNGDRIAMTPDEHIFEVVIDERPIVQETLSPRHSLGDGLPVKQASPMKQSAASALPQNNGVQNSKRENGQKTEAGGGEEDAGAVEKSEGQNIADAAEDGKKEDEDTSNNGSESAKRQSEAQTREGNDQREAEEKEEEEDEDKAVHSNTLSRGDGNATVMDGDKEVALPVQRERKLPAWMTSATQSEPRQAKAAKAATPAKKAPQQKEDSASPQKKGRGRPKSGTKAAPQAKPRTTPSKTKSRSRVYDDNDDDDYLSEEEPAPKRNKSSRSQRGSSKVASYAEDDYDDLDEDWAASDLDEDGSDWEDSHSSKKGKGKGRPAKGKFVSPRKRGRPKKYTHSSEEEDWSEEEAYVPRPTKRRSSSSNYEPAEQTKRASKKPPRDIDVSEEEETPQKQRTSPKAKKDSKTKRKDHDMSGEEEEEERSVEKKGPEKKKKPKSCQFGKRCYRKNPAHLKEFCHPGDPEYNSNSEDEDGVDDGGVDDDRPECEYGTSCYRKHPDHLKQYKHTKVPGRPQRESAKKGKKKGMMTGDDDDEDAPNTYDYNDSFLNDEDSERESGSPGGGASEDSDWGPDQEDSQDVRDLKKEAKQFIKNKKMHKA